jgi:DNA polymerase (family 10)
MSNKEIASVLQETADLIELTDGNPHRARAFSRAARSLGNLEVSVLDRLEAGTLTDVSGIGDAMADHVAEVVDTGTFDLHDELLNAVPPGLLEVMRVKGLGTKRTRRLWTELDITSLDELERAAETDRITSLDGFGPKTQENILENVRRLRAYDAQRRFAEVWTTVMPLLDDLRSLDMVERAEPTGALRRRMETLERAEVVVATTDEAIVQENLEDLFEEGLSRENDRWKTTLPDGLPLHLHVADPNHFGTTWWQTTGSEAHCEAFETVYGSPETHATEEGLFASADLPVIPPELRENRGELDAATQDALPDLLTVDDLHGCLHNHSTYSDGSHSLRTMAEAARSMGFSYFGICDHSQSLQIASGLSPEEVRKQRDEVHALNDDFPADFRIFHGIESDVLRDGSLDYEDNLLASFDFVVASVHTGFSMTEDEATERVLRAVRNPHTRILGHPTGRLLLVREGYPLDHARVIDACAEHDVTIELNANPYRLDLDWRWVDRAIEQDVLISINPDAHATGELEYVRWGVAVGRKGGLTAEHCLNAKSLADFTDWIDKGPAPA